MICLVITFLN